ncbi:MAG: hypothetical protein CMN31_09365 [Sandaracinus sp.]|nr:hypothetical protein [Sandaracinus sp.]
MAVEGDAVARPVTGPAFARDAILGSYAQILFSRSPWVGALLVGATFTSPRAAVFGLGAVLLAFLTAQALHYSPDQTRSGLFGYNALLVGLGGASLVEPSPMGFGLLAVAIAGSVLVTAAVHSALGQYFQLPALTIPFLLVFWIVLGAAPLADIPLRPLTHDETAIALGIPAGPRLFFQSLGALFFLPRVDAGAVVFLALLVHSRIATTLALLAFGLVAFFGSELFVLADPTLAIMLGYNCILTAVALGGVWFVASGWSFLFALGGVLMTGLFTLGALPRMSLAGLPLLILPFNVTVILVLYAMRQRTRDGRPKAVDFLLGTPEENLHYFKTRLARFGATYWVRLNAPFRGKWTVTQGVEGSITHKGPWRHALDFQVAGADGALFGGDGTRLSDYHCYRLPVLAVAPGVVAKVVDGVPDNPIGEINAKDNWGNLVIVWHAPGLYSLVAHLAPGSIKVREGQHVGRGEPLGLCGSSGRSPFPHLHFQLQATAIVGAPTLALELHDVITEEESGEELHGVITPVEEAVVRNVAADEDLARLLTFEYGAPLPLAKDGEDAGPTEELVADIDLFGAQLLRSPKLHGRLFYRREPHLFMVDDVIAPRRSALHVLRAALSRVPFEVRRELSWVDYLPYRDFVPWALRPFIDLVSPFLRRSGVEMRYGIAREGRKVIVRGESVRWRRGEEPVVRTEAVLEEGAGLARAELRVRGRCRVVCRPGKEAAAEGALAAEGGLG